MAGKNDHKKTIITIVLIEIMIFSAAFLVVNKVFSL